MTDPCEKCTTNDAADCNNCTKVIHENPCVCGTQRCIPEACQANLEFKEHGCYTNPAHLLDIPKKEPKMFGNKDTGEAFVSLSHMIELQQRIEELEGMLSLTKNKFMYDVSDIITTLKDLKLDCRDNSCEFAEEKHGQRTNGGCRCLSDLGSPRLQRQLLRMWREFKDK